MDKILRCDQNQVSRGMYALKADFLQIQVGPLLEIQRKRRKGLPRCYLFWCLNQSIGFY